MSWCVLAAAVIGAAFMLLKALIAGEVFLSAISRHNKRPACSRLTRSRLYKITGITLGLCYKTQTTEGYSGWGRMGTCRDWNRLVPRSQIKTTPQTALARLPFDLALTSALSKLGVSAMLICAGTDKGTKDYALHASQFGTRIYWRRPSTYGPIYFRK